MPDSSSNWIPPMRAVSTTDLPTDDGWAAELKWDGMRIEAVVRAANGSPTITLWSANGRDVTGSFPELGGRAEGGRSQGGWSQGDRTGDGREGDGLADAIKADAVLDGEVVVFDGDRPSFSRLQQRIHVDKPNQALVSAHPVIYVVFDLLMLDGNSLLGLPYQTRRRLLDELLPDGPNWRTPPYVHDDSEALLELARARNLEGIMLKRLDSVYESGTRSSAWRKVKIRRRQEFVVGAWLVGQGALDNQLGSLVVGVRDGDRLLAAGRVGSGLTDPERRRLQAMLVPRPESPFHETPPLDKRPVWVEPNVVIEVEYSEWPPQGFLRHPTYCGLRTDRDPADVVREDASER